MTNKEADADERTVAPKGRKPPTGWPEPLGVAAEQGLVGDIVRTIAPHTESDPAALVMGTITAFGNAIGPSPHFLIGKTRHALNLYPVFVGDTAKARKGSAWDVTTDLFGRVDPDWAERSLQSGLSSGEGLIVAAAGSADRRFLFEEDEFAAVLKVMKRLRSTLSTTLRRAWDGRTLQILTKANPVHVKGAHVSLVGQTTLEDLLRYFDVTDISNGLANRILWVCIRRWQLLPFGGNVPDEDVRRLVRVLKSAVRFAKRCGEIGFSLKASTLWESVYEELSGDVSGLVGAATARAEAQTRRIATIYALMDESDEVRLQHLRAALDLWRYCEASARFIFGSRRRLTPRDSILQMLQRARNGLTRTEISKAFNNHLSAREISTALGQLRGNGSAECQRFSTGGRTAERWVLTGK